MKEYRIRSYRNRFATEGRRSFTVSYRKTDLWIAVDEASFDGRMADYALAAIRDLWLAMEDYIATDSEYASSLVPYSPRAEAPAILHDMSRAAAAAGIGPMSAVAGACAREIAAALKQRFAYREIIIENGGDIYAELASAADIALFAGESPLSERIGLHIPALSPIGICTSSGTVGPSLSFGKADAVMIVCRDVAAADSYATAFANRIATEDDISPVMELIGTHDDILGAIAVKGDRMGIVGQLELRIFDPERQ